MKEIIFDSISLPMPCVYITYQLENGVAIGLIPEVETILETLCQQYNGRDSDSGSGFGTRDKSFEFETMEEACAFEEAVRKHFNVNAEGKGEY